MRRVSLLIFPLAFLLVAIGCGGGSSAPTAPGVTTDGSVPPPASRTAPDLDAVPGDYQDLTDGTSHPLQGQKLQGPRALWGLYEILIDPDKNTFEIVPLRSPTLHLNVLKFLEPNGKVGMVQLVGGLNWNIDKTVLDLDIRLVHPFPGALQFSGFDVKGILITRGAFTGLSDPDLVMSGPDQLRLMNPDGYTRWWNPREFPGNNIFSYRDGALGMKDSVWQFSSTLNGYKYFCDSLGANDPVENLDRDDRGVFRAGSNNIRHYTISVPTLGQLRYNYAIDASWEPPLTKPPVVPDDFPIEANQPEPWRIVVQEVANTLFYDADEHEQGGQLILEVLVYDWQNPAQAPAGSINQVVGEWPALFDLVEAEFESVQAGYSVWTMTLAPQVGALTSTDDVEYLIWAESSDGAGYGGILDPDTPLIAASLFSATVSDTEPNLAPMISSGVTGNASPGLTVETYTVVAIDPNGDPLTYSWTVDPLITDDPGNGDGTIDIDWADFGFGPFTVECVVSDSINPAVPATPLEVLVGNTPPTVGPVEGPAVVSAADTAAKYTAVATDPDQGQTLTFTWSFVPEGDPDDFNIPADPGDGSLTIDFSNVDPGTYVINVQVSDGYADTQSMPLTVVHNNTPPSVGQVEGKTPVTSLDTDEIYLALWSDPDKTQTIDFLWSIVPEGDPEDFSVPANPDGSINIDWSAYPVGSWTLNLLADDGIDSVEGAPLTVTRNNLPPVVGQVSGPNPVSSADTAAQYSAPILDADPDQPLVALWSVVPTGDPPDYSIVSEPDLSLIVDWSAQADGDYDVNVRVDDGIDQVEGALLTVTKFDNQPPTVGAVSGPTPVYHSDTASEYNAPISDPEGDTLTVLWSVVPSGDPPDYSIPGTVGNPLILDWSDYPDLGDYDVNVRAADLYHPPVEGTLLVVALLNSPPDVGAVSGPTPVDGTDTAAVYSAPINDIDPGQSLTILWSLVPTGDPAGYTIPDSGAGSITIDWSGYAIGDYDINVRVDDGSGPVEGTLLTVSRVNTPPVIGPITGPLTVYCSDTSAHYSATISDPDTGQPLTIMWSLVLSGGMPNYNIPDNGDGSIDVDWSTRAVGGYDINVRVDDGVTTAYGTVITVNRANTPPVVGAVTGPALVNDLDTETYYLDPPATDCDPGQTLHYWFSIQPSGSPPVYSIYSATGEILVDWSTYGVGLWTVGCRVYDGVGQSFATPLDVTVILHPCSGSAHTYLGEVNPSAYSIAPMSIIPRADIAFLDGGAEGLKGLAVAQIGPSTLGAFDADSPGATNVLWKYFLGKRDAALSIDSDPMEGRILVVTLDEPHVIKIIDSSIIFGNPIIGKINSGDPLMTWVAIDVEQDGDFWAVLRDGTSGVVYRLIRFVYLPDEPYYQVDITSLLNITPQVGTETDVFDIALNYEADLLYLLETGTSGRGALHVYVAADGFPASFVQTPITSVFSQVLDYVSGGPTGFAGYADIDVDHINAPEERCRILVYGRLLDQSGELIRLDSSYNLLDAEYSLVAWPAFAINPDPNEAIRNLIMPDTDSLEFWSTPPDW